MKGSEGQANVAGGHARLSEVDSDEADNVVRGHVFTKAANGWHRVSGSTFDNN
jgi:hypothetical protein